MRKNSGQDLESMTIRELRAQAKELGVELKSSAKKAEIIAAIRSAQAEKAQPAQAKAEPTKSKKTAKTTTRKTSAKATKTKSTVAEVGRLASATAPPVEAAEAAPPPVESLAVVSRPPRPAFESLGEQERVEESKYDLGAVAPPMEEQFVLPSTYGEDRVTLLVRDPHWLYAYWDFSPATRERLGAGGSKTVLRIKDVTNTDPDVPRAFSDIELLPGADNWYIRVDEPERDYCADLGIVTPAGDFVLIARSQAVRPPRERPSDVLAEEWRGISLEFYEQMYQLSGGRLVAPHTTAPSSPELMERAAPLPAQEYMASPGLFSGALFSPGVAVEERVREFFLEVWAELIVYGRTKPDAKVTLQGRPVLLRYDGTFTARFSLPDGEQVLPIRAVSADNVDERATTLTVTKKTE